MLKQGTETYEIQQYLIRHNTSFPNNLVALSISSSRCCIIYTILLTSLFIPLRLPEINAKSPWPQSFSCLTFNLLPLDFSIHIDVSWKNNESLWVLDDGADGRKATVYKFGVTRF